ncbi:uncharacterized protein LOC133929599 [Phragmites australis]|uniref:uncharacterized protein LOC133929599 n=1 Tax=Phragmites australis TaxID=29695 RepID=UPI002D76C9EA|nr:uncharacterized protein LOC133929599 [Phragmites australis]
MIEDQGVWEAIQPAASEAVDEKKDKKERSHLFQALLEDLLTQVARKKRLGRRSRIVSRQGETLDDAALVKKLFDAVPDRFLSVIAEIEQFYDLDKMSFEEAEWQARQKKDGGNSSSSNKGKSHLAAESSNRDRAGRGHGRGRGRGGHGGMSRNNEESCSGGGRRNKSHIKCFNCHKMGYYANECKAPKKKEEETHLTRDDDTEPALLLVVSEEPAQEQQHQRGAVLLNEEKLKPELRDTTEGVSSSKVWYLDNGASNHITSDKEKFRELDEGVTGKVKFGDGSTVKIIGLGSVVFSCKNGD